MGTQGRAGECATYSRAAKPPWKLLAQLPCTVAEDTNWVKLFWVCFPPFILSKGDTGPGRRVCDILQGGEAAMEVARTVALHGGRGKRLSHFKPTQASSHTIAHRHRASPSRITPPSGVIHDQAEVCVSIDFNGRFTQRNLPKRTKQDMHSSFCSCLFDSASIAVEWGWSPPKSSRDLRHGPLRRRPLRSREDFKGGIRTSLI